MSFFKQVLNALAEEAQSIVENMFLGEPVLPASQSPVCAAHDMDLFDAKEKQNA